MENFDYSLEPRSDYAFIDMKSYYASYELKARGLDPLNTMLVVMSKADNTGSGLILASSPAAKKRLGLTNVSRAWELPTELDNPAVKDLIIVEPRIQLYIDQNIEIQKIVQNYAAKEDIMWYSIDEGCVDLGPSLNYFVPENISRARKLDIVSQRIQQHIHRETGIYSTVGMSNSNILLAKLALDNEAKKNSNMRALWNYEDVQTKAWNIKEISDFWGIGSRMKENLKNMGIYTIKDLAHASPERLNKRFGIMGLQLYHHAWGIDRARIREKYVPKGESKGNSQMLPRDYYGHEMPLVIKEMADQVSTRLRRKNAKAGTIHLGIRYSRNEIGGGFSRQMKVTPTDNSKEIAQHLQRLFDKYYEGQLVRQISVNFSNLSYANGTQFNLFEEPEQQEKEINLEKSKDLVRDKFGFLSLVYASSLLDHGRSIKRAGLVAGHNGGGAGGLDGL
ncbi:MAG: Y-family DNA polymerase [Enterococcus gilvus]